MRKFLEFARNVIVGTVIAKVFLWRQKRRSLLILLLLLFSRLAFADCDLQVSSVRDGDTFNAQVVTVISPSLFVAEKTGFRLVGVRTPEHGEKNFDKAKKDLETMILGKLVEIRLPVKGPKRDRWGRFLVDVLLCDKNATMDYGKVHVNKAMLDKGWSSSGRLKR